MIPGIIAQRRGGAIPPGPVSSSDVLWTPTAITTALWLDADDVSTFTLTGSDIDEWRDKSGNARHATPPGTKPTRAASGINSMGSVVFPSTQAILRTTSFANPSGADGLLVLLVIEKTARPVNFSIPICKGAVNAEWSFVFPSTVVAGAENPDDSIFRNVAGQQAVSTTTVGVDTPRMISGFIADSGIQQFFSGNAEGSAGAATRSFGGPSMLHIGGGSASGNQLQGRIGELVVVHADITTTTRQLLEGYGAHKWGFTASLPGGHPYKTVPPTV